MTPDLSFSSAGKGGEGESSARKYKWHEEKISEINIGVNIGVFVCYDR